MISVHVGEFFEGLVGNEMQIYEGSKRFNITRDYGKNWFVTREFYRKANVMVNLWTSVRHDLPPKICDP